MHIKYAMLWLPDALFAEQRKGVARVEREGTGYSPRSGRLFGGRQW